MNVYIPQLKQSNAVHYVTESDMIQFIETNSDMHYNQVCDYIREVGVANEESEKTYWSSTDLAWVEQNQPEAHKWIKGFFDAHPWIINMMLIFEL